jgi:predicted permease
MILGTTTTTSQKDSVTQSSTTTIARKDRISAEIQKFLSPPVVGCILGILIGTVPLLKSVFMGGLGTPLFSAVNTLGSAYLPAAVLVLAGSLVQSTTSFKQSVNGGGSLKKNRNVSRKALWSIMASRFLLAPLLSLAIVSTLNCFNLLGSGRSKAILTFVLLMEGCMPPAQNSVIMLQLEGLTERAGRMAKMLALLYSVAVVPVTILMSGCLGLSEILNFT